jgi:glycosyltransferase involved in cell wall biosynthesis
LLSQKKILVVVESIDVEDSSGSKANVALIQNLHKAGFEVLVYHYTRMEIQLPGITCIAIKEKRRSVLFFLSRMERYIRTILKLSLSKPLEKVFGFSFTLFNDRNSIIAGLRKIDNFNPDLVMTLSQGGRFRPHHAILRIPELHKKWIAYIHDPYPAHLYPRPFAWVEAGYFQKWKFIWDISERAAYSAFPSKLLMEWMGSYYPGFLKSGVIIPHQLIELSTEGIGFPDYFDPKDFNLLHAGTLLEPRNPKILVDAFQRFLENNPEAKLHSKLIFLGGDSIFSPWLKDKAGQIKELEVSEAYVPFKGVFKMQQHAAVNIILEAKSEISPFLPGKFPHCVQADKPILLLGPNYSESKRLLGEAYPYWAEIDDLDRITKAIENLYLEWKKSPNDCRLNRPDLISYLSVPNLKRVMDKIKLLS